LANVYISSFDLANWPLFTYSIDALLQKIVESRLYKMPDFHDPEYDRIQYDRIEYDRIK
jgi:hypothetical protein